MPLKEISPLNSSNRLLTNGLYEFKRTGENMTLVIHVTDTEGNIKGHLSVWQDSDQRFLITMVNDGPFLMDTYQISTHITEPSGAKC